LKSQFQDWPVPDDVLGDALSVSKKYRKVAVSPVSVTTFRTTESPWRSACQTDKFDRFNAFIKTGGEVLDTIAEVVSWTKRD